jgi:hypothetical protein
MYTLILDEGIVLDAAGIQVALCQSADDPAFVAYIAWVHAGNEPTVIETRG